MQRQNSTPRSARQDLERAIHDSIGIIALQLEDLRSAVESLQQLRQHDTADHRLIVEHGRCGRPEVVR